MLAMLVVVGFGEKQGLVFADEVDGVKHLAAVDTTLQVADNLGGICCFPMALKGIHGFHDGVDGLVASQLGSVGKENDRDLALVAQIVVDRGITFFFGVGGQEIGDVFLIVQTQCRKHAEGRDNQQ